MEHVVWLMPLLVACGGGGSASRTSGGEVSAAGGPSTEVNKVCAASTYLALSGAGPCTAVDATCQYPEGSCYCGPRSYCGGVQPSRETLDELKQPAWRCRATRTDGCPPTPPTGACSDNGAACSYGDCCIESVTCESGAWQSHGEMCPP